jgi:HNH endonuclease
MSKQKNTTILSKKFLVDGLEYNIRHRNMAIQRLIMSMYAKDKADAISKATILFPNVGLCPISLYKEFCKENAIAFKLKLPVRCKKRKETFNFYESNEWKTLRKKVIKHYGCKCMRCGANKCEMHVDHIKPRSIYKHLELYFDNLQVLCKYCNMEKSNKNEIDYIKITHK